MPTPFHDILFPPYISIGAQTGAEFMTRVVVTGSGHEYRNAYWNQARWRGDVSYGIKTKAEFDIVDGFFRARRGRAFSFRLKDWRDYKAGSVGSPNQFTVAVGGAVQQLMKSYTDGVYTVYRTITLPCDPAVYSTTSEPVTFDLYVNGVLKTRGTDYTVDWATGKITFTSAPATGAVIGWIGHFHIPCRFDTDTMSAKMNEFNVFSWDSIPVVEVRPEEILGT